MLEKTVQPDEEFAVICRTGNRTTVLSNWLVKNGGYRNLINVRDGIAAWIEAGRLVDKSANQVKSIGSVSTDISAKFWKFRQSTPHCLIQAPIRGALSSALSPGAETHSHNRRVA